MKKPKMGYENILLNKMILHICLSALTCLPSVTAINTRYKNSHRFIC